MDIKGSNILITGATGKLASKIVLYLAKAGADCICHYNTNADKCEKLISEITAMGRKAIAVSGDLSGEEGIASVFEQAKPFGPCNVLINSASIFERLPLAQIDFAQARRTFDINLASPIMMCRHFVETFGDCASGKIINMVDVGATKPWADYTLYCASKAGLVAVTKSLAKELAPRFTVNAVGPGLIDFPCGISEDEKKRQVKMIPAARAGCGVEVAVAIKYLIENDYVTGTLINVDGGRSL